MKKKTDGNDSDSDNQQNTKKNQGFQFQTEARAVHRREYQQQPSPSQTTKVRRKNPPSAPSPTRRSKSSATVARDLASTSSTQFESKPVQPVNNNSEPKVLTLSERLASIGRITSTLDTTQDETTKNNESEETKK